MADKTEVIYDLIFNTSAASQDVATLNVQLKTIQDNIAKFKTSSNGGQNAVNKLGGAFGKTGQSVQNASFQIADFATQVNGGAGVTRALSQQLPQLLGGFGALGAVAGAAVAILVPLGAAMLNFKDYTKITADALEEMAKQQEIVNTPLAELSEKYGNLGLQIRRVADGLAQMNAERATRALMDQAEAALNASAANTFYVRFLDAMKQSWNELAADAKVAGDAILGAVGNTDLYTQQENNLSKFRNDFGLSSEAVKEFGRQYLDIQDALKSGRFEQAANLTVQFKTQLALASDTIRDQLEPVLESLQTKLVQVGQAAVVSGLQVNDLAKTDFGNTNTPGETTISKVGGSDSQAAKDAAKAAKKALAEAAAAAKKAATDFQTFIDGVDRGVTPLQRLQETLMNATENFRRFREQMTPQQVADYTAYIVDLNKKIEEATFKENWDEMAKGIKVATEQMAPLQEAIQNVGDSIQSSFVDGLSGAFTAFIEGTKSAQDAFKEFAVNFLKEITAMIIKSLILYALQMALGAAGGSNAWGSIMQSIGGVYGKGGAFNRGREVNAFANGGVVSSPTLFPMAGGQTGLMGEAGPEAIVPLTRRGGKLGVGASPVNVTVINNSRASVNARKGSDGGVTIDVIEDTVANMISRGGSKIDGAMATGFGLRRAGR
jgi:lambda family phage tail tape measure protein